MNDTDNLDCMDVDDLQAFINDEINDSRLVDYAVCKKVAINARTEGKVHYAILVESIGDRIYDNLPNHLQW